MTILSLKFLLFLLCTLIAYYLVPKRLQWCVLLFASIVFYLFAGSSYIFYAAALIVVSYFAARVLSFFHSQQKAEEASLPKEQQKACRVLWKRKSRAVLAVSLILVIGLLAFLKTYQYLIGDINFLLGFGSDKKISFSIAAPLGLSFYTLQIAGYLIDIYRGKYEAQSNFAKYALFVLFFPQITEGPIGRYDQLAPQLFAPKTLVYENLKFGAQLMLWGFFKKLVLADRLALFVDNVFSNQMKYPGSVLALSLVFYSIQIYADFSGCIDIVAGAAEMFGIRLAKNFSHPYFSKSVPEFWRRWHISLSSWFRDYVFYPVSASKLSLKINKKARRTFGSTGGRIVAAGFPVMSVWLLTGLWHGVQWNYIVWGLYYGVLILCSIIFAPYSKKLTDRLAVKTQGAAWRVFQMARTFLICTFARVFVRADSLKDAWHIICKIFGGWGSVPNFFSMGLDQKDFAVAVIAGLVLLVASNLQEHMDIRQKLSQKNVVLRWAVYYAAAFFVLIYGIYGSSNTGTVFIYEKF